jgi:hypothetical protein
LSDPVIVAAPAAVEQPVAPSTPVVVAPAVVEPSPAPVAAPAAAPEPVAAPAEPQPPPAAPTVETPPIEKPAEPLLAAEPEKITEPEAPAEPPPAPVYEPFKLPEGAVADSEAIGKFTELLGKHTLPQEVGQELMDLYAEQQGRLQESLAKHQWDTWENTKKEWVNQFENDPDMGRNRRDTTLNAARKAIGWAYGLGIPGKELSATDKAKAEAGRSAYWQAMAVTGSDVHPENVRAWLNVHNLLSKYLTERPAPPAALPPQRVAGNAADRRYGNGQR